MLFKVMHTAILVCILGIGLYVFYLSRGNPDVQFRVAMIATIAYVVWGVIHHISQGDLHPKVVLEYLLIGFMAIILLRTLLGI